MTDKNGIGVLVHYRGLSGRRVIGDYVWSVDNAYQCWVDNVAVLDAIRDDLRFVFVDEPIVDVAPAEEPL